MDVVSPTAGIDELVSAPLDGIDFVSATYLGAALTPTILIFPASISGANPCGAGQFPVNHPLAKDSTGNAVKVCGRPEDKLVVAQLPFGSLTPGQPTADAVFTAKTSNLADVELP